MLVVSCVTLATPQVEDLGAELGSATDQANIAWEEAEKQRADATDVHEKWIHAEEQRQKEHQTRVAAEKSLGKPLHS